MISDIPLSRPFLGPEEEAAVCEVLRSGWISQGPRVEEFEKKLAELFGCQHVRAVNSGTSSLMLALRALNLNPGDSVVVPAFSCAATALPVLEIGTKPLFADIDLASFNVTWETVERVLEVNTKAIIVAHMFGRVAQIDLIARECERRGLILIEDTALALGARKGGRCAGTFGTAGCFSFHPRKILTTGEGGAVCSNDPQIAQRVTSDRNYGAAQSAWSRFQSGDGSPRGFSRVAFNFKLTDLQAAIGLVQLGRLPWMISRRHAIAHAYEAELAGNAVVLPPQFPTVPDEHVFQAFVCRWMPELLNQDGAPSPKLVQAENSLSAFKESMRQSGVAISDAAQFLPELPIFNQQQLCYECPNAYLASRLAFALPIYPAMTESDTNRVLESVKTAIQIK